MGKQTNILLVILCNSMFGFHIHLEKHAGTLQCKFNRCILTLACKQIIADELIEEALNTLCFVSICNKRS